MLSKKNPLKQIALLFFSLIASCLYPQNKTAINWLTQNSIEIEDANPNSEMVFFKKNEPKKFANAKIYGFGEASHNTKEFFDIKAKFFKYLVKNHGVKTFIMEESYQAESGINEWISGGNGNVKTIANNFNIGFWYTKEIVNLLQWMRDYNYNKPPEEQIKFYGMDIQIGSKINEEIKEYINHNIILVDEKLLSVVDSCSNKKINYNITENWWQAQIPKLNQLKIQLQNANINTVETKNALRSLDYLISYVQYANVVNKKYPEDTELRDLKMFENVKYIIENKTNNGKAFIWAHNEHINNKEMYYTGSNIINLGRHLKDYYKDNYYSVGFDFATGEIKGYVTNNKKNNYWKTYTITPFSKTMAHSLFFVDKDIFFVDMENAIKNEPTKFFEKKGKHLMIGGGGYMPKPLHRIMLSKIYAKTYDGLLFVKKISVPEELIY